MPRDKTITRAGAKKPDLSALTDDQLRASIRDLKEEARAKHSILDYCCREMNRRCKISNTVKEQSC